MAILAYKSKTGDTYAIFGEGEFTVTEGIFKAESDGSYAIYCLLDKQDIIGKDSSQKDEKGKAATIELTFPIKAKIKIDKEVSVGKALIALFTVIKPELAQGFSGDINYSTSKSAVRIANGDFTKTDYDFAGGLCDIKVVELTTTFDTQSSGKNGGGYQKSYQSITSQAEERAALFESMLTQYDKPLGAAYLAIIHAYEAMDLAPPSPLSLFTVFIGGK
jgi:hypothetical protein